MEKTREQRLASKERYLAQENKAIEKLLTGNIYDFIDGLKYTLSLSMRYNKNFRKFVDNAASFNEINVKRCLKAGILKPWNDTYWFDKEKAESLQQYILEHNN